jgi:hypothetical protein
MLNTLVAQSTHHSTWSPARAIFPKLGAQKPRRRRMKATGYAALAITVALSLPAWAQVAQPAAPASGGSDFT